MAFPPLITQDMIEIDVGPSTLAQFTDDDGDGKADAIPVARIIQIASDRAGGVLRGAWPELDQIAELVTNDSDVQHSVVLLAMQAAGERRPSLRDERGKMMYADQGDAAMKALRELRDANQRSGAEGHGSVPNNPKTHFGTNVRRPRKFTFAPSGGNPNAGGGF